MNLLQIHLGCGSVYHGRASQRGTKARAEKATEVAQLRRRGIQFTFCISRT